MFANLLQLLTRRPPPTYDLAFVKAVHTPVQPEARSRRLEKILLICWVLIGLKSWIVIALIRHYQVPLNPWWINAPTVAAGAICSLIYLLRR
ncbi:hypothetical protein MASR2M8_22220 [Opitutaceae bacterium]